MKMRKTIGVLAVWMVAFVIQAVFGMKASAFPSVHHREGFLYKQESMPRRSTLEAIWTSRSKMKRTFNETIKDPNSYWTERKIQVLLEPLEGCDFYRVTAAYEELLKHDGDGQLVDKTVRSYPAGEVVLWYLNSSGYYSFTDRRYGYRVKEITKMGVIVIPNPPLIIPSEEGLVSEEVDGLVLFPFYWSNGWDKVSPSKEIPKFVRKNSIREWEPIYSEMSTAFQGLLNGVRYTVFGHGTPKCFNAPVGYEEER